MLANVHSPKTTQNECQFGALREEHALGAHDGIMWVIFTHRLQEKNGSVTTGSTYHKSVFKIFEAINDTTVIS